MKTLLSFICFSLFALPAVAVTALDIALETGGIKVEYNDVSKKGIIHVYKCEQCTKKYYEFSELPKIMRKGSDISFDIFMKDYWNAKYPTLLLDIESLTVLQVSY